jgi:hypothetical protein
MVAALGSLALAAATAALAAKAPSVAPEVQGVIDCRKIDDAAARLACFDRAAAAMDRAESSGDLVTIDREQRRTARRQAFGLSLPSLAFLDRGEKADEVDSLTAAVTGVSRTAEGKWVITVEGGAVWRQIDDNPLNRDPHVGSQAKIRKAMLGSYFMNIDRQPAIRVHRFN